MTFIYRYVQDRMQDINVLEIIETDRKPAQELYAEYAKLNKTVY